MKENKDMYSIHYPCHSYDQTLDVLSTTKTNSVKTSSLPLADFWHPLRNQDLRRSFIEKIGLDAMDGQKADYCFEYPTPAYKDRKSGVTLPYSKSSMTDLMILFKEGVRVTIEAKYTEYAKDDIYKPVLDEWLDNKLHRKEIAQCWLDYISSNFYSTVKSLDELLNVCPKLPYQFLHRTASACFNCNSPILVYQIFYDRKDQDRMKTFERQLQECARILKLDHDKLPFYIAECEVVSCPEPRMGNASIVFTKMKKREQYVFGDSIKALNGYTLAEI